jgi:hypothetical protein
MFDKTSARTPAEQSLTSVLSAEQHIGLLRTNICQHISPRSCTIPYYAACQRLPVQQYSHLQPSPKSHTITQHNSRKTPAAACPQLQGTCSCSVGPIRYGHTHGYAIFTQVQQLLLTQPQRPPSYRDQKLSIPTKAAHTTANSCMGWYAGSTAEQFWQYNLSQLPLLPALPDHPSASTAFELVTAAAAAAAAETHTAAALIHAARSCDQGLWCINDTSYQRASMQ